MIGNILRLLATTASAPEQNDHEDDSTLFSPAQDKLLLRIVFIESIFSFIGSSIIIISYLKFPNLRKFSLQLVLWLSVSDCGACLSYFLGDPRDNTILCTSQAIIQSFFELASVLWTTIIAYTLFRLIISQKTSAHLIYKFHAFAWGISLIACVLPLSTDSYGNSGSWCWIAIPLDSEGKTKTNLLIAGNAWRFFLFYFPLWLAIAYNTAVYIIVTRTLKRVANTQCDESKPKYLKMIRRLRLYPLVLILCWTFGTINRFQNVVNPAEPIYILFILQVSTRSLQGIFNASVYGMNSHVIDEWCLFLRDLGLCGCCCTDNAISEYVGDETNDSSLEGWTRVDDDAEDRNADPTYEGGLIGSRTNSRNDSKNSRINSTERSLI